VTLEMVDESKFYADSAGSRTRQRRVRLFPSIEAVNVADGYSSMRSCNPPSARGWEYLAGNDGWDFDAEAGRLPEWLAENVAAPSVRAGRYDLVVSPTNLWLTIHESVAHATELDRALGFEAAYAGTSFATVDGLGSLRYGSDVMTVTGDRITEHGLASCGWDDEGVEAQTFDIVRDGTLVGSQLNRQMAHDRGLARSNGCAYADSPGHIPLQRMPNVSLQPAADDTSVADLIGQVEHGLFVEGDKSWSIDMQRYNFQFTGQRFFAIENGRLTHQVRDVAYQATTTDPGARWRRSAARHLRADVGALNCGKGQPAQSAPVSHGAPAAPLPSGQRAQHRGRGEQPVSEITVWIEAALAATVSDDCVVIVNDVSEANLRWALNSLTTNGQMHHRTATVIAVVRPAGAGHAGVVSGGVGSAGDLLALVAEADAAALVAPPADDASPLPEPVRDADYLADAVSTSIEVFAPLAQALGRSADARARGHELFGFAEHRYTTVWLATSARAALRRAHGPLRAERQACRRIGSAWVGRPPPTSPTSTATPYAEVSERLSWCETRLDSPPAGETILPPRRRRPHDLRLLDDERPRCRGGAQRLRRPARGATRVGERLGALPLRLSSGPGVAGLPGSPFVVATASEPGLVSVFDNGAPIEPTHWVDDGVLRRLVYPRSGARASGVPFAFPSQNLVVDAGSSTSSPS
jgi:predicted Zn-dependent protease